jgi:hypothetical protein
MVVTVDKLRKEFCRLATEIGSLTLKVISTPPLFVVRIDEILAVVTD